MNKEFIEENKKSKLALKIKTNKIASIAKLAQEDFKKVVMGEAGTDKSLYILGYIAGYLKNNPIT